MRKVFACSLFLATASILLADPFAGTWKLNVAKSKPAPSQPGMAVKEGTMVVDESAEPATVTIKGTRENGSPAGSKYTVAIKGGPVNYLENGPPAGVSVAMKRINDRTVDFITTQNGKEVSKNHVTVSPDGKTMRLDVKGVDAQGKPVQSLTIYEKQ